MIAVDTTVWIDYFRDAPLSHVELLHHLIAEDAGIAITDVVLTEILQGASTDRAAHKLERRLSAFDVFRLEDLADFRRAARIYRRARANGYTIRRTLDCLIASVCIRESVPLLHADADFDRLAKCTELKVVSVP